MASGHFDTEKSSLFYLQSLFESAFICVHPRFLFFRPTRGCRGSPTTCCAWLNEVNTPIAQNDFAENPPNGYENQLGLEQDKTAPILWDQAQSRHLGKSRVLAHLINRRLNNSNNYKEGRVQGAPLLVLQGANMPGILIEIGYLSNSAEEKLLTDQQYLTDLAKKIHQGIDDYFKQQQ